MANWCKRGHAAVVKSHLDSACRQFARARIRETIPSSPLASSVASFVATATARDSDATASKEIRKSNRTVVQDGTAVRGIVLFAGAAAEQLAERLLVLAWRASARKLGGGERRRGEIRRTAGDDDVQESPGEETCGAESEDEVVWVGQVDENNV